MRAIAFLVLLCIMLDASDPVKCGWYGISPICFAWCPRGTIEVARKATGRRKVFGKSCLWGTKVFCCEEGYLPEYSGRADGKTKGMHFK